jgi:hypothetical protein
MTKTYEQILQEARSVRRKIIMTCVPELCRICRDEYDAMDHGFTDEYGNPDNDKESESYIYLRNDYVKLKVMFDLQGVAYPDKVYNRHGTKILPKESHRIGDKAI